MKRIAIVVGIVVSIAVAVGAFVIAGDDQPTEAKAPASAQKEQGSSKKESGDTKNFALVVASATRVASEGPVPRSDDKSNDSKSDDGKSDDGDKKDDSDDDGDKYEARKKFVGVSPSKVRVGKTVEFQVRGFAPNSTVIVEVKKAGSPTISVSVPTNSKGRGKVKVLAPLQVGTYTVSAQGTLAKSTLKVEAKQT
jgi:hypothetical protein